LRQPLLINLPVAHFEFAGEGHGFRQAATQCRVLELELGFYGLLFGFKPPGISETPEITTAGKPAATAVIRGEINPL